MIRDTYAGHMFTYTLCTYCALENPQSSVLQMCVFPLEVINHVLPTSEFPHL